MSRGLYHFVLRPLFPIFSKQRQERDHRLLRFFGDRPIEVRQVEHRGPVGILGAPRLVAAELPNREAAERLMAAVHRRDDFAHRQPALAAQGLQGHAKLGQHDQPRLSHV